MHMPCVWAPIPLAVPALTGEPMLLSALACKLSKSRPAYTHTSFNGKLVLQQTYIPMLWLLVQDLVWPFHLHGRYVQDMSCTANLLPAPACSDAHVLR